MPTRRSTIRLALFAVLLAGLATPSTAAVQTFDANVDLTVGGNYNAGAGVTPDNTTDILFGAAYPGTAAIFQLGTGATATSLSAQSINTANSFAITIGNNSSNTTASNATLTLGNPAGQNNAASGAAATDLLYVSGGNLTLQSANLRNGQSTGNGTMSIALAQNGNFNVAAGRTLTVTSAISGAFTLTKTGDGLLLLNASSNTFSNLHVKAGIVQAPSGGRFGTGTITLGDAAGTSDVTLSSLDGTVSNAIIVNTVTSGIVMLSHDGGGGTAQSPTFSGNITLNGALTIAERRNNANRFVFITGQITGGQTISVSSNNNSNNPGVQITNSANASSFTGNIAVTGGLLGFNSGSLGTVGTISFDDSSPSTSNSPGLVWLAGNTEDVSARLQAVTAPTTVVFDTGANTVSFATANALSGSGHYSKRGTGTLNLAVANNYSGNTTVAVGTLLANNASGSATGSGTVTVNLAGTLGGAGSIGGVTNVSGTIAPGNSAGTLTVNNNLNLNNGSTYAFEAGDLIDVNGTLDLNNNWTLSLRDGLMDGGSITLFTYDSLAATPDLDPTFDVSLLGFTPSGALSLSDTGTSIVLHGVQAVPEPASLSLLAMGLSALLKRRRRC